MRKIFLTLTVSLLLTACGGGGSSSEDSTPQTATPATPSSNVAQQLKGDWITDCQTLTDGTSGFVTYTFTTLDDGSEAFFNGIASFETSNCSDGGDVIVIGGPITYSGEFATSICIAEKIDQELILATDGDNSISGSEFQQLLIDNQLPDTVYDIACRSNNQLFFGLETPTLNARSNATRPQEMDVSIPFDIWVDGPSARTQSDSKKSLSDNLKQISQRINIISK